jgi:4-amino-4-deoxy-L-arabinose transferase-like glycosyltransferase
VDAVLQRLVEDVSTNRRAASTNGHAAAARLRVLDRLRAGAVVGSASALALRDRSLPSLLTWAVVGVGLAFAGFVRFWQLGTLGYNSDEAVYAGQAAAIADVPELQPYFPLFRAHPLLFQSIQSLGYRLGAGEFSGRLLAAFFGLGTIALVYATGRLLYGRKVGAIAALLIALMPYDVLVSRQVLLDGPTTFFTTVALYLLARYAVSHRRTWLFAAAGALGLAALTKETSILMVGAVYAFVALSPEIEVRLRDVGIAVGVLVGVLAAHPLTLRLAGHSKSGENYLAYQLFRRPNHDWTFYPTVVPVAMGVLVVAAAVTGLWLLRREISWRETLLLSWIALPALFFQLYPVKGFQYLLPTAPAVALLAARTLGLWSPPRIALPRLRLAVPSAWVAFGLTVVVAASLAVPSWARIHPSNSGTFLAGSGGLPGGREVGRWIRTNVPQGAQMLAIGPSMANVVQFYGHRKAYGLSVGTNPLRRNPAYDPLPNPDLAIRENDVQYLVWDAFSAARSPHFSDELLRYKRRYNGRTLKLVSVRSTTPKGHKVNKTLIIVIAVRP